VRSLRFRIFLILCVVGIIPCTFLRLAFLNNYEKRAVSVNSSNISNQLAIIADHLLTYNYLLDTSSEVINAELEQLSNLYDGRVIIIDNDLRVVKDTYSLIDGKTIISQEVIEGFKNNSTSKYDANNRYIEITTPIIDRTTSEVIGVMLTSVSAESIYTTMSMLGQRALLLQGSMAILIIAFGVFFSFLMMKPFRKMIIEINGIKEGFEEEEIHIPDFSETEALSDAFNQVMHRMNALNDSRKEFVSNVSHELKTPITSVKVLAESLVASEDTPIEMYREFMQDIVEEINREDKIITDLLSLVRLDKSASDLIITTVDINDFVEKILKMIHPIADLKNVELLLESIREVSAEIDETKLSLAISNLVENAVKYNKDGGWVKVSVDADTQYFTIVVSDSGMGIPEESLPHIFERFYRVDKSHSKEISGTGLGLAITRNTILMHRGAIKAESVLGEGTTFTVKIPKYYVQ